MLITTRTNNGLVGLLGRRAVLFDNFAGSAGNVTTPTLATSGWGTNATWQRQGNSTVRCTANAGAPTNNNFIWANCGVSDNIIVSAAINPNGTNSDSGFGVCFNASNQFNNWRVTLQGGGTFARIRKRVSDVSTDFPDVTLFTPYSNGDVLSVVIQNDCFIIMRNGVPNAAPFFEFNRALKTGTRHGLASNFDTVSTAYSVSVETLDSPITNFTPLALPNLVTWLDANTGSASSWGSVDGSASLTAVAGRTFPSRVANAINGNAVYDFNGSTAYIRGSLARSSTVPNIFMVARWRDIKASPLELSSGTTANSHIVMFNDNTFFNSGYATRANTNGSSTDTLLSFSDINQYALYRYVSTSSSSCELSRVRSESKQSVQNTYAAFTTTANTISLGSALVDPSGYSFDGSIAEVIIVNGVLPNSLVEVTTNYLLRKYNI